MKTKILVAALWVLALSSFPVQAMGNGELVLKKEISRDGWFWPSGATDFTLYKIAPHKDVRDLRDFRDFFAVGAYTMYWHGVEGETITLFAGFDFEPNHGFLILKKLDKETVWILELEDFPPNQWIKVPATEDGYGGYEAYYSPGSLFEFNLASVKWGQWWDQLN